MTPIDNSPNPYLKVKDCYQDLMGTTYGPISDNNIDHVIHAFFKAVKKSKDISCFELKLKKMHPLNQQAILLHGRELAKANKLDEKNEELNNLLLQMKVLKTDGTFEEIGKDTKFDYQLEDKSYSTASKVLAAVSALLFIAIPVTYFFDRFYQQSKLLKTCNSEFNLFKAQNEIKKEDKVSCDGLIKDYPAKINEQNDFLQNVDNRIDAIESKNLASIRNYEASLIDCKNGQEYISKIWNMTYHKDVEARDKIITELETDVAACKKELGICNMQSEALSQSLEVYAKAMLAKKSP